MANNPVDDRYNPPGIGSNDFDEVMFEEVEDEDLFWLNTSNGDNNPPYRKINDGQGYNTRTGIVGNFERRQIIFQRT